MTQALAHLVTAACFCIAVRALFTSIRGACGAVREGEF